MRTILLMLLTTVLASQDAPGVRAVRLSPEYANALQIAHSRMVEAGRAMAEATANWERVKSAVITSYSQRSWACAGRQCIEIPTPPSGDVAFVEPDYDVMLVTEGRAVMPSVISAYSTPVPCEGFKTIPEIPWLAK